MIAKEGDRFECIGTGNLWEIRDGCWYRNQQQYGNFIKFGSLMLSNTVNEEYYKYLGNFSKSSNFNNLYSLLCEK